MDRKTLYSELVARLGLDTRSISTLVIRSPRSCEGYSSTNPTKIPPQEVLNRLRAALSTKTEEDARWLQETLPGHISTS